MDTGDREHTGDDRSGDREHTGDRDRGGSADAASGSTGAREGAGTTGAEGAGGAGTPAASAGQGGAPTPAPSGAGAGGAGTPASAGAGGGVAASRTDVGGADHGDHGDAPHPPYMLIWGILAVLMLGKVGVAFIQGPKWVAIALLVALSLVSALLVALYYMHLRFEPKRLWVLAFVPIPLAIIFILAVLTEFR